VIYHSLKTSDIEGEGGRTEELIARVESAGNERIVGILYFIIIKILKHKV